MISQHQIEELNERLRIDAVVGDYVRLKSSGNRLRGLCPFHTEKTPSFTVTPDKNMFFCFGCQKGGTMIGFVMDIEKLNFPEAFALLCERAGIQVEQVSRSEGSERQSYIELYRRLTESFHHILLHTDEGRSARGYLDRRLIGEEVLARYHVGYAPRDSDWLYRFLKRHNYGDQFLMRSGLFTRGRGGMLSLFRDRIIFPISTARGEVVAFGGRALGEGPKYLNTPETAYFRKGELLYGLAEARNRIKQTDMVYVVEGYLDVMALDALQRAAVAPLGTALRNAHAKVLSRYTTDVRLVMDADDAGIAATKRAISVLEEIELQASVVALQEGLDPADYIERKAGNRLQATLSSPILSYEYLLRLAVSKRDLRRADGKEQAFRELLPYLTNVRSELKREALLRDLADVLEVSHDSVLRDFRRRTNRRSVPRRAVGSRQHEGSVSRSAEMAFMLAAAANRDKFDRVQRRLTSNDLQDSLARELFLALQECTYQGDTSPDGLLSKLEHEELRLMVIRNLSEREFTVNPNEVLDDGARRLKVGALERRRRKIESLMRQEEGTDERSSDNSVRDLLEEKMFLDSELEKLKRVRVDVGPID